MAKKPHLRMVPPRNPTPGSTTTVEWVGGRIPTTIPVEGKQPGEGPDVVIWAELPSGVVLATVLIDPGEEPYALTEMLTLAADHPMGGPPRFPDSVRVASPSEAEQIVPYLPADVPIRVAPTPELRELVQDLEASLQQRLEEASYFDDGRLSGETLAKLFRGARDLHRRAPWKTAFDHQILRLDVPELGIDGACLSILGALDETLGFVVFESLADYEAFTEATDARDMDEAVDMAIADFGAPWIILTFEPAEDVPEKMRQEVRDHHWPLAGPGAYPLFGSHSRDGSPGSLDEAEALLVAVAADALAAFARTHPKAFKDFDEGNFGPGPIILNHRGQDLPACTVTFPLDLLDDPFEDEGVMSSRPLAAPTPNAARPPARGNGVPWGSGDARGSSAARRPAPGRNDPCPCGSGKKYKKCHAAEEAEESRTKSTTQWMHDLDRALVEEMLIFASKAFPAEWSNLARDPRRPLPPPMLSPQWVCFHASVNDRTIVEWFLESHGKTLQPGEKAWIRSQRESWLSVWEVREVEPGRSLVLRDLLSGVERTVIEAGASQSLNRRAVLLGRIVEHEGISVLCGMHPQSLAPSFAEKVVEAARGELRLRGDVPPERLRDAALGRILLDAWEAAIVSMLEFAARPPTVSFAGGPRFMDDLRPAGGAEAFESPQAAVRAFKERHYGDWELHPLPAFGGCTPKEMCATREGREAVDLLLREMEYGEEAQPADQRYDFGQLRRRLGFSA